MIARAVAFEEYELEHMCEKCGKIGRVEVHHLNKERDDNSRENLRILCRACHNQEHNICVPKVLSTPAIVREYFKPGATLKSVGKHFGVSPKCIAARLEDAGYNRKKQGSYQCKR